MGFRENGKLVQRSLRTQKYREAKARIRALFNNEEKDQPQVFKTFLNDFIQYPQVNHKPATTLRFKDALRHFSRYLINGEVG